MSSRTHIRYPTGVLLTIEVGDGRLPPKAHTVAAESVFHLSEGNTQRCRVTLEVGQASLLLESMQPMYRHMREFCESMGTTGCTCSGGKCPTCRARLALGWPV